MFPLIVPQLGGEHRTQKLEWLIAPHSYRVNLATMKQQMFNVSMPWGIRAVAQRLSGSLSVISLQSLDGTRPGIRHAFDANIGFMVALDRHPPLPRRSTEGHRSSKRPNRLRFAFCQKNDKMLEILRLVRIPQEGGGVFDHGMAGGLQIHPPIDTSVTIAQKIHKYLLDVSRTKEQSSNKRLLIGLSIQPRHHIRFSYMFHGEEKTSPLKYRARIFIFFIYYDLTMKKADVVAH
ncbi:hypothetical protein IW261DRAFT_1421070 [Armillaria novae-zelandiae]|uniref:Uncharacterized protein n=1 Tax=Armillaria novae-zelandiae TaxID=153914 RepID=A0AA39P4C8_9AGAR|nr:hypothetical protein IW261DRAFT_1421070 [Armillaria novae-zelandiae]